MKLLSRLAFVTLALISTISHAWANTGVVEISQMRGKILVNSGNGYAPVPDMSLLNEGDTVMVGDGSSAIIVYVDTNCRVKLPAKTVTTITLPDPCKSAAAPIGSSSSFISQPATWLALGGLAFAGGIAFLVTSHDNEEGNDSPLEPGVSPP